MQFINPFETRTVPEPLLAKTTKSRVRKSSGYFMQLILFYVTKFSIRSDSFAIWICDIICGRIPVGTILCAAQQHR